MQESAMFFLDFFVFRVVDDEFLDISIIFAFYKANEAQTSLRALPCIYP
jgi:hypothetical protein